MRDSNIIVRCVDPSSTLTKDKVYRGRGVLKRGTIETYGVPFEHATHITIKNDRGEFVTVSINRFVIHEQKESTGSP